MGSLDNPFNPVSVALGAEATFVARTLDSDRKHLTSVLRAAADHQGTALVEIYQNCNIFNDGAFDLLKDADTRDDWTIRMEHGQPLRFGADGTKAVLRSDTGGAHHRRRGRDRTIRGWWSTTRTPRIRPTRSRCPGCRSLDSRYSPMGVFRSVQRPTYDAMMAQQLELAAAKAPGDEAALDALLRGADTWSVA